MGWRAISAQVPRRELEEAAGKLQEVERLRRWSEIAQSENIARLLGPAPTPLYSAII
jgi:hypothetical protein